MEIFHYHELPIELTMANMSAADILLHCTSVCKRWNQIISSSTDLWQSLLIRDYNNSTINDKTTGKREYETIYKRILLREAAVENCVKAFPLFDVEMLEASISSNIVNLNRPRLNLEALLLSQHLYAEWSSPNVIPLGPHAVVLLSHVLSKFCAEFLYDAGMVTLRTQFQINSETIRFVMQGSPFFASSIFAAMVGSPIRIHPQNIYNILNTLRWEQEKGLVALTIARQGLATVISFLGDIAAQLAHAGIALARKNNASEVGRDLMFQTIQALFPPAFVNRLNNSVY